MVNRIQPEASWKHSTWPAGWQHWLCKCQKLPKGKKKNSPVKTHQSVEKEKNPWKFNIVYGSSHLADCSEITQTTNFCLLSAWTLQRELPSVFRSHRGCTESLPVKRSCYRCCPTGVLRWVITFPPADEPAAWCVWFMSAELRTALGFSTAQAASCPLSSSRSLTPTPRVALGWQFLMVIKICLRRTLLIACCSRCIKYIYQIKKDSPWPWRHPASYLSLNF